MTQKASAKTKAKRKAKPKAKPARRPGQPKRGALPWKPTRKQRELITHYVAIGLNQEQIATIMQKSVDSLRRHCRHELDAGMLIVNSKLGSSLIQKALGGDTTSLIFCAKARLGWKERQVLEHAGEGGGPVLTRQMSAKEAAQKYREKLG